MHKITWAPIIVTRIATFQLCDTFQRFVRCIHLNPFTLVPECPLRRIMTRRTRIGMKQSLQGLMIAHLKCLDALIKDMESVWVCFHELSFCCENTFWQNFDPSCSGRQTFQKILNWFHQKGLNWKLITLPSHIEKKIQFFFQNFWAFHRKCIFWRQLFFKISVFCQHIGYHSLNDVSDWKNMIPFNQISKKNLKN